MRVPSVFLGLLIDLIRVSFCHLPMPFYDSVSPELVEVFVENQIKNTFCLGPQNPKWDRIRMRADFIAMLHVGGISRCCNKQAADTRHTNTNTSSRSRSDDSPRRPVSRLDRLISVNCHRMPFECCLSHLELHLVAAINQSKLSPTGSEYSLQ